MFFLSIYKVTRLPKYFQIEYGGVNFKAISTYGKELNFEKNDIDYIKSTNGMGEFVLVLKNTEELIFRIGYFKTLKKFSNLIKGEKINIDFLLEQCVSLALMVLVYKQSH